MNVCSFLTDFSQVDEKKAKVGRRISARVTDFFKIKKQEVNTPAKVDENPPVIDEPTPLPPLENPATDAPPAPTAPAVEASEPAPAVTPVIAAAA